jgi:hypothetical protein
VGSRALRGSPTRGGRVASGVARSRSEAARFQVRVSPRARTTPCAVFLPCLGTSNCHVTPLVNAIFRCDSSLRSRRPGEDFVADLHLKRPGLGLDERDLVLVLGDGDVADPAEARYVRRAPVRRPSHGLGGDGSGSAGNLPAGHRCGHLLRKSLRVDQLARDLRGARAPAMHQQPSLAPSKRSRSYATAASWLGPAARALPTLPRPRRRVQSCC